MGVELLLLLWFLSSPFGSLSRLLFPSLPESSSLRAPVILPYPIRRCHGLIKSGVVVQRFLKISEILLRLRIVTRVFFKSDTFFIPPFATAYSARALVDTSFGGTCALHDDCCQLGAKGVCLLSSKQVFGG